MQQILCAAITYEGKLDDYKRDPRIRSHTLTDSIYDTLVANLKVYQAGVNQLGTRYPAHRLAYHQLLNEYPEFADNSWHYTGGFFYDRDTKANNLRCSQSNSK